MSFIQQYKDANVRKEVATLECVSVFKDALVEAIKPVFDKFDKVESVSVWGYTPSFADGDIPTFSLNIEDATINGVDPYDYEDDEDDEVVLSYEELSEIRSSVYEALGLFDESDWASAFNSYGFKAIFNRDEAGNITVTEEDYDCGY